MVEWEKLGMPSNRAEFLSGAVRANMKKAKDLPIAQALQPVAAVAWAVVDGLMDDDQLLAAAVAAQKKLALHLGAIPERALLIDVIEDCTAEKVDKAQKSDKAVA